MTEFIYGSSGSGKGSYIVSKIRERLGSGKKKYLIVPEQEAVLWETRIAEELPPSSALELETLSFRRLADTVFRTVGGLGMNYTGKAKKILLMWNAVTSVSDSLEVYSGDGVHEEKYVPVLLETLGELRTRGISPASLDEARIRLAEDGGNEGLIKKLSDLSLIFSAYLKMEEEDGCEDPDNALEMLARVLRENPFFKGCDVFIDSFYSLTPVENEILYYIMREADDVFITFTMDDSSHAPHFEHVKKFFKSALSSAARCKREVIRVPLKENLRCRSADILYLEKNLWNFSAPPLKERDGGVRIIRCRDRYEEARAICGEIERLVREGASYSGIAVVANDIEAYRGILDVRLDSLKIPYHLSRRSGIATSPVTSLITSLLETVAYGFRRESYIKCLKTGLCPVTEREISSFEEYATTWNLRGKRAYLSEKAWEMNPAGYKKGISDWGRTVLDDANRVKEVMREPFSDLAALFSSGESEIADVCRSLYDIIVKFGVYEALCNEADRLRAEGKIEDAENTEKSFSAVVDALSAMGQTVPHGRISPSSFARLFSSVASSYDTGTIPSGIDKVTLGSASGIRCANISHVILAGCIEGEFPHSGKDGGFLTEYDKEALEGVGLIIGDSKDEQLGEELFRFWRCVTMPSCGVTVTYPATSDNAPSLPSVGARQIMRLLSIDPVEDFSSSAERRSVFSVESAKDALINATNPASIAALMELSSIYPELSSAPDLKRPLSADADTVSRSIAGQINSKSISLTQSRIDCFSECPFSYYMKYVLELGEPQNASVRAVDVGTLVHRVLELFFSETRGRVYPLSAEETDEIVERVTRRHLSEIMNGAEITSRQKYLFNRLRRNVTAIINALMEEFSETDFRPYRFELPMEESESSPAPLELRSSDGTKITLYGTIDRVDTFTGDGNVYVRVVDYKTYVKSFNREDIQKGLNLQLMIYLFTLWKGRDCKFRRDLSPNGETVLPGGMLYLSTTPDKATADAPPSAEEAMENAESTIRRSGVVLDDVTFLTAMGAPLGSKYLPPKSVKKMSIEDFSELYDEIVEVIKSIADEIKSGRCGSIPNKHGSYHPCTYCKMRPVCRHLKKRRTAEDEQ